MGKGKKNFILTFRTEGFCSISVEAGSLDEAWHKAEKLLPPSEYDWCKDTAFDKDTGEEVLY